MQNKKKGNPYKKGYKKFKRDPRQAIGKEAYEKLDSSPYPKSQRPHKRNIPWRKTDGKKYPCITYKNGYQHTEEYKEKYGDSQKIKIC